MPDAAVGVQDDRHRFHRRERRQRGTPEVGVAGGVDQVEMDAAVVDGGECGIEGMPALLLDGIEIGNGVAALDGAGRGDCAAGVEQGLEQQRLAGAGLAGEGHVADLFGGVGHERFPMAGVQASRRARRWSSRGAMRR